jgi:hypothetical protein
MNNHLTPQLTEQLPLTPKINENKGLRNMLIEIAVFLSLWKRVYAGFLSIVFFLIFITVTGLNIYRFTTFTSIPRHDLHNSLNNHLTPQLAEQSPHTSTRRTITSHLNSLNNHLTPQLT